MIPPPTPKFPPMLPFPKTSRSLSILAPVLVMTNALELVPELIITLPFATGMFIPLVPLLIEAVFTLAQLKLPAPSVRKYCPVVPPVIITLPTAFKLLLPVTDKLPATLAVPVILAPVPVTTNILALPFTLKLILPSTVGIDPLLVPLLKPDTEVVTVAQLKLPAPSVCKYCPTVPPVIITLPTAFRLPN